MNAALDKNLTAVVVVPERVAPFEWLLHGTTAKSPQFDNEGHSTGEKPIDYQDRLGAIAAMNRQLAKSIASLVIYNGNSQGDYEYVRNYLARIMMDEAYKDKRREPAGIAIYHLAWLVARKVINFALNPKLERFYTKEGNLYYMGIGENQMTLKAYDATWKQYEDLMVIAFELGFKEAVDAVNLYKKNTYKDAKQKS